MTSYDTIAWTIVIVYFVLVFLVAGRCCLTVREKETRVVEYLGKYARTMSPGIQFYTPFLERLKKVKVKYTTADSNGNPLNHRRCSDVISLQNEVIDFPKQAVITRDNARIFIDAILQYRIINAEKMVYSVFNLPNMLSRLLQSHLRDVAGSLDVDRIIEDSSILDRVSGDLSIIAREWGVQIEMVKIQRVQADTLTDVLAQKKTADFKNQEIVISANTSRRTAIIDAEGKRDQKIREAEGETQKIVAQAKGQAQAILNEAQSEARSIAEISRSLEGSGSDPTKYLMALKYIEALKSISMRPNTKIVFVPKDLMMVQASKVLGITPMMNI